MQNISLIIVCLLMAVRFYLIQAKKDLSVEQKAILIDVTASKKTYLPILILLTSFFTAQYMIAHGNLGNALMFYTVGFPLLYVGVFFRSLWSRMSIYERLKAAGLPQRYLKKMLVSMVCIHTLTLILICHFLIKIW